MERTELSAVSSPTLQMCVCSRTLACLQRDRDWSALACSVTRDWSALASDPVQNPPDFSPLHVPHLNRAHTVQSRP